MVFEGEFERNVRRIDILGLQQTSYADWSRAVLSNYPFNPKFQKQGSRIVVFVNNKKVAFFDFEQGMGSMSVSPDGDQASAVGTYPSLQKIDIDNYLQQ